jgi:chromosome segregation ATPase
MKEGYLQRKLTELNDQCRKIEQKISFEETTLERLQQRVGEFKELIKKLDHLQEFKKQSLNQIKEENSQLVEEQLHKLTEKTKTIIEKSMDNKSLTINEVLERLIQREEEIKKLAERIQQQTKQVDFLMEYNDLLMMKLVNKGILSDRDVNEMTRRAQKASGD